MLDRPRPPRILIAAGGTGGHVYPAIATAEALRRIDPEVEILFVGGERMEARAVPKAGFDFRAISASGLQRRLTPENLVAPFRVLRGLWQSWRIVGEFDPDVAFGTGGYVSWPPLMAANLRGRPIVLQEQNVHPGWTNRMLGERAFRVHVAFREAVDFFPLGQAAITGNPTRKELADVDEAAARAYFDLPGSARVLLILGGSLGSRAINKMVERHVHELLMDERVHVLWQTGTRYYERLKEEVAPHARLHLLKYIDRMDYAYAVADLAVSRSGALTCSELLVTATPAVLVPSPNVTADHQALNARSLSERGAAVMIREEDLEAAFAEQVQGLLDNESLRLQMADRAFELAIPGAADEIAEDILRIAARRFEDH